VGGGYTDSDNQILAALLTVARNSTKPGFTSKRMAEEQWHQVWNDHKRFFKELEQEDNSIDNRGINPDWRLAIAFQSYGVERRRGQMLKIQTAATNGQVIFTLSGRIDAEKSSRDKNTIRIRSEWASYRLGLEGPAS